MNIHDMFDRILLRSGQYIIKKAKVDIDVDSFRVLVEDALADYSKSVPHEVESLINLNNFRSFIFPVDYNEELQRRPDWLSEVTPTSSFGSYQSVLMYKPVEARKIVAEDPVECPWVYNKQTHELVVPYSSYYKIIGCYKHIVVGTFNDETGETDYDVPTISLDDQLFFKLLRGMFLQGIGRSRRAFTLSDLPIVMDADQLVSDGVEMEDKAREDLKDVQKFYLSYGG